VAQSIHNRPSHFMSPLYPAPHQVCTARVYVYTVHHPRAIYFTIFYGCDDMPNVDVLSKTFTKMLRAVGPQASHWPPSSACQILTSRAVCVHVSETYISCRPCCGSGGISSGFDPRSINMKFFVEKLAVGHVLLQEVPFLFWMNQRSMLIHS
jgi:hypothetical protein